MNCLHAITIWICSYKGLSKIIKGNLIYDIMMKIGREIKWELFEFPDFQWQFYFVVNISPSYI